MEIAEQSADRINAVRLIQRIEPCHLNYSGTPVMFSECRHDRSIAQMPVPPFLTISARLTYPAKTHCLSFSVQWKDPTKFFADQDQLHPKTYRPPIQVFGPEHGVGAEELAQSPDRPSLSLFPG